MTERPRQGDSDAWRRLLGDVQAVSRLEASGISMVTVRLMVQDGVLVGWSTPRPERWHDDESSWVKIHGIKPYKRDA